MSIFAFDLPARVVSPAVLQKSAVVEVNSCRASADNEDPIYYPLIIKLRNPAGTLPSEIAVIHRRGPFVLAYVPQTQLSALEELGNISRVEGGLICTPNLDQARLFCGLPEIEAGEGFPALYTGKGVVAGFTDIGFDPNHPAFTDPTSGKSRVKELTTYGATPESVLRLATPEEIAGWSTDNSDEWHGTHVAGILAGGYQGNPYYGIAREADIVATTGMLYSAQLLAGMEDVIAYARQQGKPAVINMSVGSTMGPHDGTSLFCQYLELLAEEAVICISAGNDAGRPGRLTGSFPEDGAVGMTCVSNRSWVSDDVEGYMDVWGENSTVSELNIVLQKDREYTILHRIPCPEITSDAPEINFTVASSADVLRELGVNDANGIVSEDLARYFKGYITVTTEINPENGRFNALVFYNVEALTDGEGMPILVCNPGIEVVGRKGEHIDIYCSESLRGIEFRPKLKGFQVTVDGYINDFITGNGVIGVGAMASRDHYDMLNGETYETNYPQGWIASFSSYSSGNHMPVLPDIVAPGAYLISPISTPFVENHPEYSATSSSVAEISGKKHYWFATCGTSMSSPFVAGVMALWLQADPTLTSREIKEIMSQTADHPVYDPQSPRWGKGILNARAGLQAVISRSGTAEVAVDKEHLFEIIPLGGCHYRLETYVGEILRVEIFSMSGVLLFSDEPTAASADIDASPWVGEPLILRISTAQGGETMRLIAR